MHVEMQADAMTTEEREAFRKHVASELAAASVECGHNVMHQFTQSELEAAGTPFMHLPFCFCVHVLDMATSVGWIWWSRPADAPRMLQGHAMLFPAGGQQPHLLSCIAACTRRQVQPRSGIMRCR